MPINTLISAVQRWTERNFAAKKDAASAGDLSALATNVGNLEHEVSNVVEQAARAVVIVGGAYIETSWNSTYKELKALVDGGKPYTVTLEYHINDSDTERVAASVVRTGSFVEVTFDSSLYSNVYTFVVYEDGATELTVNKAAQKMPKGTYNNDVMQYQLSSGGWKAVRAGSLTFTTQSGTITTLAALEARVAAIESTPNAEGVSF